jgi:hypothetical protein
MLPAIIVVFATYHYVCRLFAKNKMTDKYTQTEVPWLFYSQLISEDYMDTSYESVFDLELDEDDMTDSPPASDWSVNSNKPDVVVRQMDL